MAGRGRPRKMEITEVIQNNETNEIVVTPKVTDITTFELSAEITAGKLTSNAKELEAIVKNELQNYTVEKYIGEPTAAAKDKAILNKLSDGIAAKRKEITTAWNKPLDEFLDTMKGLEKSIKEASSKLKTITDEAENQEKEIKKQKIADYFKTLDFNVVSFEKIFNPKWLNKTVKIESVMLDIESITERIAGELATIKSMQDEDKETLMSFYLDTLDLNATLQKGNQLKANRQKLREEEERKAQIQMNSMENELNFEEKVHKQAEIQSNFAENMQNTSEFIPNYPKSDVKTANSQPVMTFVLKLTATKDKLQALRKYIDENGIKYEKVGM